MRVSVRLAPFVALSALALRVVACSNGTSSDATSAGTGGGNSGTGGGAGSGGTGVAGSGSVVLPDGTIVGGACPCPSVMTACAGPDMVSYKGQCATQPDGTNACAYSPTHLQECADACGSACSPIYSSVPYQACTVDSACTPAPSAGQTTLGMCGMFYSGACVSAHCHWKYSPMECPGSTAGGMWGGGGGFAGNAGKSGGGGAGKSGGGNGGGGTAGASGGGGGAPPQTCTNASQCLLPASSCDGNNLVFWTAPTCMGTCSFTMNTEACAGMCMGGQCVMVDGGADGGLRETSFRKNRGQAPGNGPMADGGGRRAAGRCRPARPGKGARAGRACGMRGARNGARAGSDGGGLRARVSRRVGAGLRRGDARLRPLNVEIGLS